MRIKAIVSIIMISYKNNEYYCFPFDLSKIITIDNI